MIGVNVGRLLATRPDLYSANLDALFDLFRAKGLSPVVGLRRPLSHFAEAMSAAMAGSVAGRIVVTMNEPD